MSIEQDLRAQWPGLRDRLQAKDLLEGEGASLSLRIPGSEAMWFGLARDSEPQRLGTASGFVNTGGFTSTIGAVLAVGVVLQLVSPAGATTYSLDAYRWAFTSLLVPWTLGVWGVLRTRNRTRALLAREGVVVPPLRQALRRGR